MNATRVVVKGAQMARQLVFIREVRNFARWFSVFPG